MTPAIRAALEAARHELTTLDGLWAHDGDPAQAWRLDTQARIAELDAVLAAPSGTASPTPESMIRPIEETL